MKGDATLGIEISIPDKAVPQGWSVNEHASEHPDGTDEGEKKSV